MYATQKNMDENRRELQQSDKLVGKKRKKEMLGKVAFFFRNTNGCLQELMYTKINISFKPLLGRIQKARHDKPSQKTRSYIG